MTESLLRIYMHFSQKVMISILCVILAGVLVTAGCTSTLPVSSAPVRQGTPLPVQKLGAYEQPATLQPSPAAGGLTTTDDDTRFSNAVIASVKTINPLLQKVGTSSETLDIAALRENGTLLALEADNSYKTISAMPVSGPIQPVKDNYLKALQKFSESGTKIHDGLNALEKGDDLSAEKFLTEAGEAIAAGSEYLNMTETAAQKIGF